MITSREGSAGSGGAAAAADAASAQESAGAVAGTVPESGRYDWDRLDRAVHALVEQQRELRDQLARRDARIRALEAELLEANQLRQDTAKRVDELIGELDQLDEQLSALETGE